MARYLSRMKTNSTKIDVIYNDTCPVCAREVSAYRRYSEGRALPISYHPLDSALRSDLGLSANQAARRFHVVVEGTLLDGMDAFRALWSEMPRLQWLSRVTTWPILRVISDFAYDRIAAPILYALHKRRQGP